MFRLAARSLTSHPVRSAVLAVGFGLGITVMAGLLGVGDVILEQAESPVLDGGGDVVLEGPTGAVSNAAFVTASIAGDPRVVAAAPSRAKELYLVDREGAAHRVFAIGAIPSLSRALDDPETASIAAWVDAPGDRAWTDPDPDRLLRRLDRGHDVPDAPWRASWLEWWYFNATTAAEDGGAAARLYATFLVGPPGPDGVRAAGVRLQLDRGLGDARSDDGTVPAGRATSWWAADELGTAAFARAPELDIGASSIRLEGGQYVVAFDFPGGDDTDDPGGRPVRGTLRFAADVDRAVPPFELRGRGGWLSGYTVPVPGGPVSGTLRIGSGSDAVEVELDGGAGYHDHNWGFWEGVTWQWGQATSGETSIVYGRVRPPRDVADPDRTPAVVAIRGAGGPEGFATRVDIDEIGGVADGPPERIDLRASGPATELRMSFRVDSVERSPWLGRDGAGGGETDLLQMRGTWTVDGVVDGSELHFETAGSAEVFRPARS